MKRIVITLLMLALTCMAFFAGHYHALAPNDMKSLQAEQDFYRYLYEDEKDLAGHTAFRIVQYIDNGETDKARDSLNLDLDIWIQDKVLREGWLDSERTWAGTLFLSKVGRHRAKHPVEHDDPEFEKWISSVFHKSMEIDAKHYGTRKEPNK